MDFCITASDFPVLREEKKMAFTREKFPHGKSLSLLWLSFLLLSFFELFMDN
jgi:hypothetical protein